MIMGIGRPNKSNLKRIDDIRNHIGEIHLFVSTTISTRQPDRGGYNICENPAIGQSDTEMDPNNIRVLQPDQYF